MTTARARARAEMSAEILGSARRQLAVAGPAALSLRAVARDIGVVSSAVYRYVSSRDELITALLVQCYEELGAAVGAADSGSGVAAAARHRWRVVCRAIRSWAIDHPHEYALLYGSPVPGYRAPEVTIPAATRVTGVVVGAIISGWELTDRSGVPAVADPGDDPPRAGAVTPQVRQFLIDAADGADVRIDDDRVERAMLAWSSIFGLVSFELFGHFVGSVGDPEAYFAAAVERLAADLGLAEDPTVGGP